MKIKLIFLILFSITSYAQCAEVTLEVYERFRPCTQIKFYQKARFLQRQLVTILKTLNTAQNIDVDLIENNLDNLENELDELKKMLSEELKSNTPSTQMQYEFNAMEYEFYVILNNLTSLFSESKAELENIKRQENREG